MKKINYLVVVITILLFTVACKNVDFKKTRSGLVYKLFPGNGKDSLIKVGQVVKFNYKIQFNDSMMERFNSYGKMPGYVQVQPPPAPSYDFTELLPMMKKGDSVVTVLMVDSILKSHQQLMQILPPNAKKGDRLTMHIKVENVFSVDSLARADAAKEMERDRPRAMKEQEEELAKQESQQQESLKAEAEKYEKSGEAAKEIKEMEAFLAAKKITAQKTGHGTFVHIEQQGTGPAAEVGKYVKVKYTGKIAETDSTFESNVYPLHLGKTAVIIGWTEGLQLFKQGGKGTIYIPGFLAYGASGGPGRKPFTALKFDVEILEVSDKPIEQQQTR